MPGFWDAIKRAVPNLLLVHSFIPDANYYYAFNSVSWYLSDLAFLYLLTPAFSFALNQKIFKNSKITICLLFCIYLIVSFTLGNVWPEIRQWLLYILPVTRSFDFVSGMVLGKMYIEEKNTTNDSGAHYNMYALVGIILFIMGLYLSRFVPQWAYFSLCYYPGTVVTVYGVTSSSNRGMIKRILSNRFFEKVTSISLELYLVHQIVINYVESYSTDIGQLSTMKYITLVTLATTIIATFIHTVICKK